MIVVDKLKSTEDKKSQPNAEGENSQDTSVGMPSGATPVPLMSIGLPEGMPKPPQGDGGITPVSLGAQATPAAMPGMPNAPFGIPRKFIFV